MMCINSFYFVFANTETKRRNPPMLRMPIPIHRVSNRPIKFFSLPICRRRPTRWCCLCCLINSLDLRRCVWYPIVMILLLWNLPRNCRVTPPRTHCKDLRLRRHMLWRLHLLKNSLRINIIFYWVTFIFRVVYCDWYEYDGGMWWTLGLSSSYCHWQLRVHVQFRNTYFR